MELPCTCHVAQRTCALNRSIWRGNMNDEGKAAASAGGAVGLSALASFIGLCCIGPWSVALFGVSGAIALARWQTYRPHILIVAGDRKSTRLNSSHYCASRMPSSAFTKKQ